VQEEPGARAAQVAEVPVPVPVRVPARVPGAQVVAVPVLRAEALVTAAEAAQAPGDHHLQPSAHPVAPPT
jgi:hypothetical protein